MLSFFPIYHPFRVSFLVLSTQYMSFHSSLNYVCPSLYLFFHSLPFFFLGLILLQVSRAVCLLLLFSSCSVSLPSFRCVDRFCAAASYVCTPGASFVWLSLFFLFFWNHSRHFIEKKLLLSLSYFSEANKEG